MLAEYAKVLPYPRLKLEPEEIRIALDQIHRFSTIVHPSMTIDEIKRDESDNRFLECAEEARADYLVTGNLKHFPATWKTTRIVNGRQLLIEHPPK